jgi:hypothetical protein
MQSEPHVFRDMTEIDLAQAFPLAQATGVAATLDGWLAFTGDLLRAKNRKRTGLRALVNDRGTIVGLIMFAFTGDPRHGTVLEITHILALNRVTAEALVEEGLRLAGASGCKLVRSDVSVGDLWLGDFLRRHGFTLEHHRLARALIPQAS